MNPDGSTSHAKANGVWVIAMICSVMALPIAWGVLSPGAQEIEEEETSISQRCIDLFSQALVSPSSVNIVHIREYDFRDIGSEIESPPWSANIEFDSSNAFGAMLRGRARCEADENGEVTKIAINGEPLLREELLLYKTRLDIRSR